MGCDIHMHVEFKKSNWTNDIGWKCGDYFTIVDPTDPKCEPEYVGLCENRNYDLFAVLADVRNYGDFKCISSPRGLPDDVTDYVEKAYEEWSFDAHSTSYLTMREIVEFHEAEKPTNMFGRYILEPLIERLVRRADELYILYDFEAHDPTPSALRKMEDIRIVFWFDN